MDPDNDSTRPEHVVLAEELAHRWLPCNRKEPRSGTGHASRVVQIVDQMPGVRPDLSTPRFLEALAWGHELMQWGRKDDGIPVRWGDLRNTSLPDHVSLGIRILTYQGWMTRMWWWRQVETAPELVRMVAITCRIAELEAGAITYDRLRWRRLAGDTNKYMLPHLDGMGLPWGPWLRDRLMEGMAVRPAVC